jgi:purine/pyrimidine-nucleoside phosphorylase
MFNVNEFFNGNVKSLAFNSEEGKATIGVMAKGEYEFGTSTKEKMTVISGELTVQLPGETTWNIYKKGNTFFVDADKKFKLKVSMDSAYLCIYS